MKAKTTENNTASLFFQGMGTIGQIFPPIRKPQESSPASAWQGVGDAFAAAGDNLRLAIREFKDARGLE
jgi:hypothetical protein